MKNIKKPDLKNPRVRAKCLELLKLVDELEHFGERPIGAVELTKTLGNQNQPLGAWLRLGLERFGSYSVDAKRAYSYRPNKTYIATLRQELNVLPETALEVAERQNKTYTLLPRSACKKSGHRYYGWWTWCSKPVREALFLKQFPRMFVYDISVARPTVLRQMFLKVVDPMLLRTVSKYSLPTWTALVTDRTTFRTTLANDLGITYQEAKDLCQSITNGGWASTSPFNPFCKEYGMIVTMRLMEHELYKGLREDFKTLRSVLLPNTPAKECPTKLYHAYEVVEDLVMTLVEQQLTTPAWFIHDGFVTYEPVTNLKSVTAEVEQRTGYAIQFEEEEVKGH